MLRHRPFFASRTVVCAALSLWSLASAQQPPAKKDPPAKPAPAADTAKADEEKLDLPTLWVGDAAPQIAIAQWLKGGPVETLQAGKVYVVVTSGSSTLLLDDALAPLTAFQQAHAAAGVTVIVTMCHDDAAAGLERARKYVAKHQDQIGFACGFERDSQVDKSWRIAARQVFAPNYFLVDAKGKLAWIGELEEIAEVLPQVLAGKHDLKKAAADYRVSTIFRIRTQKLAVAMAGAKVAENWPKVIDAADALLAIDPVKCGDSAGYRLLALGVGLAKPTEAYAWAKTFAEGPGKNSPAALNAIAWAIVDPDEHVEPRDLEFALGLAKRAVELSHEKNADILDTLTFAHFERDELDLALAAAKKCAALDENYKARVEQLETAIAERKAAGK